MGVTSHRRAAAAVAFLAMTALPALTGCGGGDNDDGTIELTVSTFGRFGYSDLIKEYQDSHPNIRIVERTEGQLSTYNEQLTQRLAANSGAGDVVAIEEGILTQFLATPTTFVDFNDHGVDKTQWLDWRWQQSLAKDDYQIGLPTDVGGLAMCYRRDLFEKAGLPTDRDQVSALWPDWDSYIEVGKRFTAKNTGSKFIDAATNTYNSILRQQGDQTYFDKSDNLVIESSSEVRTAWDISMRMIDADLSANLVSFSDPWNAGFRSGSFATIACPAWMTGYIKEQAGDTGKGLWDIAKVPGNGGNWGGSFLAVPKQSEHQAEAVELAKFLTSPSSQLAAFKKEGNLPSAPSLYDDPALAAATNPYFNDAPVGEIFTTGAKNLTPTYLGSKNQAVRDVVENAIRSVEQGQRAPDQAWQDALTGAEAAV